MYLNTRLYKIAIGDLTQFILVRGAGRAIAAIIGVRAVRFDG